jgi:hypothetical protein
MCLSVCLSVCMSSCLHVFVHILIHQFTKRQLTNTPSLIFTHVLIYPTLQYIEGFFDEDWYEWIDTNLTRDIDSTEIVKVSAGMMDRHKETQGD